MSLLPTNLDYTDKDFESVRARLIALVRTVFPEWTDFNVATFGTIMLESFAFIMDVLTFYQDNQGREAFIPFAAIRKNMIALARQFGYEPAAATAATTDELFTLAAVPVADVVIPAGTRVFTKDVTGAIEFQLLVALTIPSGTDPPQAFGTVEHSLPQEDTSPTTGLPDMTMLLTVSPYVDDSAIVVAANGAYTQVDTFLDSESGDRHYMVLVDEDDRATILFGNGINGEIPVGTITVDYKTGGGSTGNVEANTITRIAGTFTDVLANPVVVTVNNPEKASGGRGRETVEEMRVNAPASLRTLTRTVALEDYVTGAEGVNGVARALMLTADQSPGLPENRGYLYVVPEGGGAPSSLLKANVLTAVTVTRPNTITFRVEVRDAVYRTVDVSVTAHFKSGVVPSAGKAQIEDALEAYFAITNADGTKNTSIDFGANIKANDGTIVPEIALSDVFATVEALSSVRKIGDRQQDFTLEGRHEDLVLLLHEFPVLGTVTVIDGDTGLEVV